MTKVRGYYADPSWNGVIQWGGLALFVAGIIPVIFVLSVLVTNLTLPLPAIQALEAPAKPSVLFILASFGELLLLPGGLALYFALRNVRKTPVYIATGLWVIVTPMFLASRGLILSISQLSGRYLETASPVMKAAYIAAVELAIETQNIYAIMALTLLCAASIIMGLVMLKSEFGRRLGYLAIAAGIFTLYSPYGVLMGNPVIIPFIGLVLTAVWQSVAGVKLYNLGKNAGVV